MHMLPDTTLLIKAPIFTSQRAIDKFIAEHQDWIEKRAKMLREIPVPQQKQYASGETFLYLGRSRILDIGRYKMICVEGEKLLFPDFLQFRIQKELTSWYIKQAERIITEQVEYYAKQMKTSYKEVSFSDTKSKWGHCTHDNRLQCV